jgi:hypothetical protein
VAPVATFHSAAPKTSLKADAIGRTGAPGFHPAHRKELAMKIACFWPQAVSVCSYTRVRLGKVEHESTEVLNMATGATLS